VSTNKNSVYFLLKSINFSTSFKTFNSGLPQYDAAQLGEWFPMFWWNFFYGSTAPFRVPWPHFEVSWSHTVDTPHSVGLLWTRDQLVAETSTLATHNTHKRQTSMPPVGIEPTILVSERPQIHALDRNGHWDRPIADVHRGNLPCATSPRWSAFSICRSS
jgi:hypothetical protein